MGGRTVVERSLARVSRRPDASWVRMEMNMKKKRKTYLQTLQELVSGKESVECGVSPASTRWWERGWCIPLACSMCGRSG